jgi:hypothetical protein
VSAAHRLLVLCYFFPPLAGGGVHRVLGFTRHLPAHGWSCTVIAAGEEDYWVTDPSLAIPSGTEVIRVTGGSALAALLRMRGAARGRRSGRAFSGWRALADWWLLPDSYAGWARRARRAAARRIAAGGIDAVLTSSPPDSVHLAAPGRDARGGAPWVADFRDPWIGLHFRPPPTAWHRGRQSACERRVLEAADLVLAASRTHAGELRERATGPLESRDRVRIARIEHLPNGFEPEPDATSAAAAGPAMDSDRFTLAFTGTLSLMPDTGAFLEALHDLFARQPEARRQVRARLVGPYDADYADRATALGLTGIVTFTGPRPHAETRAIQRSADCLLLWKPAGEGYRTMVPGKLYEYFDAGRPVLAMLEAGDEAAELVRDAGGEVVPPARREPLGEAIERRWRAWRAGERPAPRRPEWLAGHTRAGLAGRLAGLLDGLLDERGERRR